MLLQRTRHCSAEVARAVEAAVLPAGADLVPADLARRVDRAVLRIESEQAEASAAEQRHADAAAQRHTFAKPLQDGMGLAGAVLTAEQLAAWERGLDRLERRERRADRDAGVERTAAQRRADLFAALPAMVLAGTAQDRAAAEGLAGVAAAAAAGPCSQPADGRIGLDRPDGAHGRGSAPGLDPARPDPAQPDANRSCDLRPWTLGPEQLAAQVVLNVLVPVSTVLDLSRAPGTLDRYGPISAEHVRLLRPHSWRRVLVDATTGRPARRRRPHDAGPGGRRSRPDRTCRTAWSRRWSPTPKNRSTTRPRASPGSSTSATCTAADQGAPPRTPTATTSSPTRPDRPRAGNLGLLSPRCHRAKHAGWTLVRHPDGSTTWTSPVGRTYQRPSPHDPPPHVDLDAEPPPLRARPRPEPPDDDPQDSVPVPRRPERHDDQPVEDDDPPPF